MLRSAWSRARAISILTASLALLLSSALPVSAANTPFDKNIVVNPGAENGAASQNPPTDVVAIPGWSSTANTHFTVVKYGAPNGYPTIAEGQRIIGGEQFFAAGLKTAANQCNNLTQTILIKGRANLIDNDHVRADLSAWIATFDSQAEAGSVSVFFLSDTGSTTGSFATPVVSKTNSIFQHKVASMVLPRHTRKVKVALIGLGTPTGAECDAYFDKISVKLHQI
jgi:hypothetical protein